MILLVIFLAYSILFNVIGYNCAVDTQQRYEQSEQMRENTIKNILAAIKNHATYSGTIIFNQPTNITQSVFVASDPMVFSHHTNLSYSQFYITERNEEK